MIPEYQTWRHADELAYLVKDSKGAGGYFVDVQASQDTKEALGAKLSVLDEVSCQWLENPELSGYPDYGKALSVRDKKTAYGGSQLLVLVGKELKGLGFERVE